MDIEYAMKENIKYRQGQSSDTCYLHAYYPRNIKNVPVVIWVHGGGLDQGETEIPPELKNQGFAVFAINYRLYPDVKFPVHIEDAAAAIAWVVQHIDDFNGDLKKIILSGHSAGCYLALMNFLDKKWLNPYAIDPDSFYAMVSLSSQVITHFAYRKEKGILPEQPIIDEFAPLYHVRKNASKLILVTGDRELDIWGRYEENAYMARMMKVVGHNETELYEVRGTDHGGMLKEGLRILLEICKKIIS